MKNHRYLFTVLLLGFLFINSRAQDKADKLVILHTNDLHSRLDGYAPSSEYTPGTINDDSTLGGFSRIASLIREEREKTPDNLLVLDDGDFLMGTIYHYMEEHRGFQLPLMKRMGYDLVALGNHEFDFGPDKLAVIIEKSLETGDIPGLLLGNAEFNPDDKADDKLEKLFSKEVIRRSVMLERDGINIGVFSLMGQDADEVAPLAKPVTFSKQVKTAKIAVRKLKDEGADIVICLSHSGIEKDKKERWSGEDVELAKKVKNLDLIISGHTHTVLEEALTVSNTIIVQTGSYGMNMGRVEISLSEEGLELIDYSLVPVDDSIEGDKDIQNLIDKQKKAINERLFMPLGYDLSSPLIESAFELECNEYGGEMENSELGPLVADAIYKYINSACDKGTDIAMVATGVIRDGIKPGILSVQDIFRVMSLGSGDDGIPGYPLATVYLNGIELKRVIEVLLFSSESSPSNYCFFSGIEADMNPDKGMLRKIQALYLVNESGERVPVDLDKKSQVLYSVSANAYMLNFIGIIKKSTFGLVKVYPKFADGKQIDDMSQTLIDFDASAAGIQEGKEWIALVEYLKNMDDTDGDGIPDMDDFYRKPPLRLKPVMNDERR